MDKRIIFYIIDEDENLSDTLQKLILKVFPTMYVKKFKDGFAAIKALDREKLEVVIICEYDLQSFNGLLILKKIRSLEQYKDTYFVMMSSNNDREILVKSVQYGVDDFINKPFSLDQFLLKLKTSSRILNYQSKILNLNNELLEAKEELNNYNNKIRELFANIQHLRFPEKEKEINRIVSVVNFIAKQLTNDSEELNQIELAAKICFLPKVLFKDKLAELPIMINGIVENQNMMAYIEYVKAFFAELNGFEQSMDILSKVYENFDGSGIPNKLKSWEIPLGARILRVAIEFEFQYSRNPKLLEKIIPSLWAEINHLYDFRILAFFDQYLAIMNSQNYPGKRASEVAINPFVLKKGTILSRDIITISGLKLLSAGTKLDDDAIKKIQDSKTNNSYIGQVFAKIESVPV